MSLTKLTMLVGAGALLVGCTDHPLNNLLLPKDITYQEPCTLAITQDVDILFVVDNSRSMGEAQAILANDLGTFIESLASPKLAANYRIGFTTTDNGHPACPAHTAMGGRLVLSSCKDRIDDFTTLDGQLDASDIACHDICSLDAKALEILPTRIEDGPAFAPRPWLESIDGVTNLPATTDIAEAFKCFGPQGINGCGFESPLESMYLALLRAQTSTQPSYGFLRSTAMLAVVFVTDEADCSFNKAFSQVFDADGNKVFWSDPQAGFPTSAVCWNAGVSCSGDPGGYDSCDSVNKDVDGNEGVSDELAVMHPMRRYVDLLDQVEDDKRQHIADPAVIVSLIGGVGADGVASYRDVTDTDPQFQDTFGIGPGCVAANPDDPDNPIQAVPPVRLRELVESFSPGNLSSICEPNYTSALADITKTLEARIIPACYTACVGDIDETTPLVEPECVVEHMPAQGGPAVELQECVTANEGYVIDAETGDYVMPGDTVDVCYALLTDRPDQVETATTSDDMSPYCEDLNYNLEVAIARRPGVPAPAGLSALCRLADFPEVACPGIGG